MSLIMPNYIPPSVGSESFHCPHCETYAHQNWKKLYWRHTTAGMTHILDGSIAECSHCEDYSIWVSEDMIYPEDSPAPLPAEDMPADVEEDFNEARQVVTDSPRAAAALLRLAMEKLAQRLTRKENRTLYNMIGDLVENDRIDERVQMALDSVRVTGNESVHPGELDMRDDRDTALRLFELVNIVVELTISREALIEGAYDDIPDGQREGIEDRDGE